MSSPTAGKGAVWTGIGFVSPLVVYILGAIYWAFLRSGFSGESVLSHVLTAAPFVAILGTFGFVRVKADDERVNVALGLLGLPRFAFGLDQIEAAEQTRARPLFWGGWGIRYISGGSAVVLRGGRALQLTMPAGRRFVVTVGHADDGARAINEMIERSSRERRRAASL